MRVPYSIADRICAALAIVLTVGVGLWLLLSWSSIPATIPSHYNAAGMADAWGDKGNLWVLWWIGAGTLGLILGVGHFPRTWNVGVSVDEENRDRIYRACRAMLCQISLATALLTNYLTMMSAHGLELGSVFWLFMLVLFAPIAGYFYRVRKKST